LSNLKARHAQGFTLIEMMIVVVLIAIVASIALPSYRGSVVKSRRSDCQSALMSFAQSMEKHYATSYSYKAAGVSDADTGAPAAAIHPSTCPIETGGATHYTLTIQAATDTAFTLRATPGTGSTQVGDGYMEINSLGQRFWDTNNDGDTGDAGENDWRR
jgi:type IV pilus assembly protein PilE